jgi:hypothetical protein
VKDQIQVLFEYQIRRWVECGGFFLTHMGFGDMVLPHLFKAGRLQVVSTQHRLGLARWVLHGNYRLKLGCWHTHGLGACEISTVHYVVRSSDVLWLTAYVSRLVRSPLRLELAIGNIKIQKNSKPLAPRKNNWAAWVHAASPHWLSRIFIF